MKKVFFALNLEIAHPICYSKDDQNFILYTFYIRFGAAKNRRLMFKI